jgi:CTP:molybdopterin cytidylyltransferase MocA
MSRVPLQRTVVVLGAARDEIIAAVPLHGAEPVLCDDWEEGQSAALRAGVAACVDAEAVVVTLGDQPLISSEAIERVVAARRGDVVALRATYGGRPGHPVLLEHQLFGRVRELRGDSGARDLLVEVETAEVGCDGLGTAVDVDTRQQLAELEDVRR